MQEYWYLIVPFVGLLWWLLRRSGSAGSYPFERRSSVMTRNEQEFYRALLRAAGRDFDVFAMVRMADLLTVRNGVAKRQSWQSRINCKHIDFVLCDMESQEPLLAIEIDDRSHQRKDRQERDYFVDRAFDAAGLPLLRIHATRSYSADELRPAVDAAMKIERSKTLASERRIRVGA